MVDRVSVCRKCVTLVTIALSSESNRTLRYHFNTVVNGFYKKWGKLDLNQRPAGYEGGGLP